MAHPHAIPCLRFGTGNAHTHCAHPNIERLHAQPCSRPTYSVAEAAPAWSAWLSTPSTSSASLKLVNGRSSSSYERSNEPSSESTAWSCLRSRSRIAATHEPAVSPPAGGASPAACGCHGRGSFRMDCNRSTRAKKMSAGRVASNAAAARPSAALLEPAMTAWGWLIAGGSSLRVTRWAGDRLGVARPPGDREELATGERASRLADPRSGEGADGALAPRGSRSAAAASGPSWSTSRRKIGRAAAHSAGEWRKSESTMW
mmetsp:Transcript_3866/g.11984  ORF Transcript_3866/g.11984 Transcript_3866/m.11984 type:complete len:259 (-) Transcript_3866:1750-2526(-)